jgi:hypothetical protein
MARARTYCATHSRWHSTHVAAHERVGRCPRLPARPCPQPEAVARAFAKGISPAVYQKVVIRRLKSGSRRQQAKLVQKIQAQAAVSARR